MNAQERTSPKEAKSFIKAIGGQMPTKDSFKSLSVLTLLISNVLIAIFVIVDNQSVLEILWVYWFQSIIIGVFNFFKIITLKDYSIDGLKMNNKPVTKSKSAKTGVAIFFLFHYGFFHFVYAVFLSAFSSFGGLLKGVTDLSFILFTSIIYFANYTVEFIMTFKRERSTLQSLPKVMMAPYKRIIPMHLTIILSGFVLAGGTITSTDPNIIILTIFLVLKTFIDLITHS